MNEVNLSKSEAIALCSRREADFFDRKAKQIAPNKVQKIAVAFANADGGEFVVGIADDEDQPVPEKRWDGFENPEKFNDIIQALFALNPSIDFKYEFLSAEEFSGFVLRVYVSRSSDVCVTADRKVFQRQGASSVPIVSPEKIQALSFSKGASSFEDYKLNIKPEIIVDSKEIKEFCSQDSVGVDPLSYSVNEAVIDRSDFSPTCAGVLLFADNPQPNFPRRCGLKIVFYDTSLVVPEREHLKINESVEGCLNSQFHSAIKKVEEIMSSISILTPNGLSKVSYPPEAIWEVVANAIIHRDYSISDDIQINIYQNRIDVKSPGKLPGFVNESNYLDVRYSRNPKIVRTLARYKNAINKDLGEGLNTAFDKMKQWKLQSPILKQVDNYVVVTLPHTPLATPEEAVMNYLSENDEIRNSISRQLTGIRSENQMKEVFNRLKARGLIERVPEKKGKSSAWRKVIT